jgi:hypothetical protein
MLTNAEVNAVLSVLWHTHAIRPRYEDRALHDDEMKWKNSGGLFTNFSRYHSQKWKETVGPDDLTVRGRRISRASMIKARHDFEESHREPVILALELADKVRTAVTKAIKKNGSSEDGDYEDEVGTKAWRNIVSEPAVREKIAKLAREWCEMDASSIEPFT